MLGQRKCAVLNWVNKLDLGLNVLVHGMDCTVWVHPNCTTQIWAMLIIIRYRCSDRNINRKLMQDLKCIHLAQHYSTLSTIHIQLYKPINTEVLTHYCLLNYSRGAIY